MCGKLHHFDWHSGDFLTSDDEQDWNNFLIPSAAFQQIFQDGLPSDKSQVWKCGEEYCMEAEITPNSKFYENQWWSKKTKKSQLTGKQLCAYGPFVEEEWHGKRPEVHPSELYWWKDDDSHSDWLLLQEDASGRFDKRENYANTGNAPATWHPWAIAPRGAEFRLAFEVDASHGGATYFINERNSFNARSLVPPDSAKHLLKFGDNTLEVTEVGAANQHMKVSFVDLCLTDNKNLEGYIAIATAVGLEKSPGSGGQELIEITSTQTPIIPPAMKESYVTLFARTPSLIGSTGKEREIGDLSVRANGTGKPLAEGIAKIGVIGADGNSAAQNTHFSKGPERGMVQGVDAIKGATLEIEMQSGEKKQGEIPPLGLALSIKEQVAAAPGTKGASSDREVLVRAVGGEFRPDVALDTVQHHQVQLLLGIHYAPMEEGEIKAEDSSPFSAKLNALLLKNDPEQIRKALGSTYPFKAGWTFEAWEFFPDGTSKEFPVAPNTPATEERIGTSWHARTMNPALVVDFPPGKGRLFKVLAIGTYIDPSGATGKITDEIWNQEILVRPADWDGLLNTVAVLGGLTDSQRKALIRPEEAKLDPLEYLANPGMRRADFLKLQAKRASQTGHVSIQDFRELVSKAKSLAPKTPE
jgi:hypothetical protein